MIIDIVLNNEKKRNLQMIEQYESLLLTLPKGSLICKKNGYYYLKYRDGNMVCDKYIGKDGEAVKELQEKLAYRKHCEKMLSELKTERKKILKMVGEKV